MKWNILYQITAASRTPDPVLNWICWTPSPPNNISGYATVYENVKTGCKHIPPSEQPLQFQSG